MVPALVALVAALLVSIAAVGGSSPISSGDARDAQSYADDYGVSVSEAERRMGLQAEAGKLGAALTAGEAATFGGLWIVHTPQYAVKVAFTGDGEATLEGYVVSSALADVIDVVSVDTTLAALLAAQSGAKSAVTDTGVGAEYGVMVQENAVDVLTLDKEALERALDSAGAVLPTKARVKEVSALSAPVHDSELHGGEHLRGCTSGFGVEDSNGTQGITTAGHCPDVQSRSGTSLTLVDEWEAVRMTCSGIPGRALTRFVIWLTMARTIGTSIPGVIGMTSPLGTTCASMARPRGTTVARSRRSIISWRHTGGTGGSWCVMLMVTVPTWPSLGTVGARSLTATLLSGY